MVVGKKVREGTSETKRQRVNNHSYHSQPSLWRKSKRCETEMKRSATTQETLKPDRTYFSANTVEAVMFRLGPCVGVRLDCFVVMQFALRIATSLLFQGFGSQEVSVYLACEYL